MNKLEEKIMAFFKKVQVVSLATITPEGKPWVRYVTLIAKPDFPLMFCTDIGSRKVGHIKRNPEVHITCGAFNPPDDSVYLQIQGRASIVIDQKIRTARWHKEWLKYFKGPDDPRYVIVQVDPYRIEFCGPESLEPEVWERTVK